MKIAVIIPAYNEATKIGEVVSQVRKISPHVFVIDDGSADATASEAAASGAIVLRHVINRGQGAALQTGLEASVRFGAEVVVTFDADGQMSAEQILAVAAPVMNGSADVALGSRFLGVSAVGIPFSRRLVLKAGMFFTRLTTGLRLTDTHNGFRAFSREAAQKMGLRCDRMAHASEILEQIARHRLRYAEVPVAISYTEYSLAKGQKLSGAWRIMRDLLISPWVR